MINSEHLKDMDIHFMMENDMFQIAQSGWREELILTPEGERYIESQILSEEDEKLIQEFLKDLDDE